jgi:predicted DNA-binding transcriptional regulator AlpA
MKPGSDPYSYPPRDTSRVEAARYVGIGLTKFHEMVRDRRMPSPKRVDRRVIWDRLQIDAAFTDLPEEERSSAVDRIFLKEPIP